MTAGGTGAALLGLDTVLVALATGAVVDWWRNGSVFAAARARAEVRAEAFWSGDAGVMAALAALAACDFCLTVWAATATAALALGGTICWAHGWPTAGALLYDPVVLLAGARLSWVGNGLLPGHLRYDRDRDGT